MSSMFGDVLMVSVSQMKAYLQCPAKYMHRYVLGTPPAFLPVPLAFGTAFHSALGGYYSARKEGRSALLEELQATFRDAFEASRNGPVPLQEDEDSEKGDPVDQGALLLEVFHAHADAQECEVEAVEQPFTATLHDPDSGEVLEEKLAGVIDLVVREDGRPVVVEHKTSARKYGVDQLRYDFQPTAYRLALREQGVDEPGLRFQVVTKTKKPQVQVEDIIRTASDETDFRRTAVGVLRAVDAGAFYPVRGWACRSCPFAHACEERSS